MGRFNWMWRICSVFSTRKTVLLSIVAAALSCASPVALRAATVTAPENFDAAYEGETIVIQMQNPLKPNGSELEYGLEISCPPQSDGNYGCVNTATPDNLNINGNTISFYVDYTKVGNVPAGAPADLIISVKIFGYDPITKVEESDTVLINFVDTTRPNVTLTSDAYYHASNAFTVTATFTEVVTGLMADDIIVGNGTKGRFTSTGETYTIEVFPTLNSAVTVDIANDVAFDFANNGNVRASQLSVPYVTTTNEPTSLVATAGDGQVSVAFTAPSNDNGRATIENYKYSTDNGSTYTAFATPITGTTATILGLTNGTPYDIKLRAVNAAGDGTESDAVTSTPAATSNAPTALVATPGDGKITVAFTVPSNDGGATIASYEYSTDGGTSYTAV